MVTYFQEESNLPFSFSQPVSDFLHRTITAAIVTTNKDGTPQVTYVWYEFDGNRFLVSTTDERVKYRNIMRDNRVVLSMLDPDNPYKFATVRCRATVSRDQADDLIHRLAIKYQGAERGDKYGRQMASPHRVVLTLEPEKVYINGF